MRILHPVILGLVAVAGLGLSAVASAQAGATFTVRNDSNRTLNCAIKKLGSGVAEEVVLRPGQELKREYPKPKARNFRCLGAAPIWYVMQPGVRYRMTPNRDGLIVLVAD